jgi:hypothetical protein
MPTWILIIMQTACWPGNNAPPGVYDPPKCDEYSVKEVVRDYDSLDACQSAKFGPKWMCVPGPLRPRMIYSACNNGPFSYICKIEESRP